MLYALTAVRSDETSLSLSLWLSSSLSFEIKEKWIADDKPVGSPSIYKMGPPTDRMSRFLTAARKCERVCKSILHRSNGINYDCNQNQWFWQCGWIERCAIHASLCGQFMLKADADFQWNPPSSHFVFLRQNKSGYLWTIAWTQHIAARVRLQAHHSQSVLDQWCYASRCTQPH